MAVVEDLRRRLADAQAKGDTAGAAATQAEINKAMGISTGSAPSTGVSAYDALFGNNAAAWNGSPETVGNAGGSFGIPKTTATPIIGGDTAKTPKLNEVVDPLAEYRGYIQDLADAASSKSLPFEHPDLVNDDDSDNEEIL